MLVGLLRDRQRRPARFKPGDSLASLFAAYEVAVRARRERSIGSVVPLGELSELLTMLPGQAREDGRQEFARDVYLLDESGETRTRGGARIEFPAGAGARTPRGALVIVTREGAEKRYQGVAFMEA